MGALEDSILQFILNSPVKITFSSLRRHFCGANRTNTRELKRRVAHLIKTKKLCYQSRFGNTVIEVSYDLPVAVSEHVLLKPPQIFCEPLSGQRVVALEKGVSFGGGEHPSTRLAIQLIDKALHQNPWNGNRAELNAVDIGTGSGVLAIVAAKLGLGHVRAIDSDPCAVFEAKRNVRLNDVERQVFVSDGRLIDFLEVFDLVFANLRAPTLLSLREALDKKAASKSALVLSGIKSDEAGSLCEAYAKSGYCLAENRRENDWCALCLVRGDFPG